MKKIIKYFVVLFVMCTTCVVTIMPAKLEAAQIKDYLYLGHVRYSGGSQYILDYNNDKRIDLQDYAEFLTAYNGNIENPSMYSYAYMVFDTNHNGVIDDYDLNQMRYYMATQSIRPTATVTIFSASFGDFNNDGKIDDSDKRDFDFILSQGPVNAGLQLEEYPLFDIDNNGKINQKDYDAFMDFYNDPTKPFQPVKMAVHYDY